MYSIVCAPTSTGASASVSTMVGMLGRLVLVLSSASASSSSGSYESISEYRYVLYSTKFLVLTETGGVTCDATHEFTNSFLEMPGG